MEERREQHKRTNEVQDKRENDSEESGKIITDKVLDPSSHTRDVNSRRIFKNAKLTCQFLKDYSGISIFANLEPEDIEDVTSRYQAYLGVEFETDTVKKIRIQQDGEKQEIYVIPLIEHKSQVDYNIQMQILRYMSVIWYDYGKQKNSEVEKDLTRLKKFRYPPIIPIVYYEGKDSWTADTKLWKRIEQGDKLKEYIPDFTYKIIRVHDYTNEEIQKNEDEMSLVMMFNKIQSPKDYEEFLKTSKNFMGKVLTNTPQELLRVLQDVFWALLMKMNVSADEAEVLMDQMEARNMGYLFESAEKMDIQAERRNTEEAQKRADEAEHRADEAEHRADEAEHRADEAEHRADEAEHRAKTAEYRADTSESEASEAKKNLEETVKGFLNTLIGLCKGDNLTKDETKKCLRDLYKVKESDLADYFDEIWNHSK